MDEKSRLIQLKLYDEYSLIWFNMDVTIKMALKSAMSKTRISNILNREEFSEVPNDTVKRMIRNDTLKWKNELVDKIHEAVTKDLIEQDLPERLLLKEWIDSNKSSNSGFTKDQNNSLQEQIDNVENQILMSLERNIEALKTYKFTLEQELSNGGHYPMK